MPTSCEARDTAVHASAGRESSDVAALRETIASLEAQLVSLYAERDADTPVAAAAGAQRHAACEERLYAEIGVNAQLRESLASCEAQLVALYDEKVAATDARA